MRKLDAVVYLVVMVFDPRIAFTNTATVVVAFPRIPPDERLQLAQSRFMEVCRQLAHRPNQAVLARNAERAFQIEIRYLHDEAGAEIETVLRQAAEEAGLRINLRPAWVSIVDTMGY